MNARKRRAKLHKSISIFRRKKVIITCPKLLCETILFRNEKQLQLRKKMVKVRTMQRLQIHQFLGNFALYYQLIIEFSIPEVIKIWQ